MKYFSYLFVLILLNACAKMPIESITLTDSIITEGQRMHDLNLTLLNRLFLEKSEKIDLFIKEEYTPAFLDNFKNKIPPGIDIDKELPGMLQSIIPQINERRNMMNNALESQRIKLIEKLELDYKIYEEAITELRNLIESNVKVNEERQKAFEKATNLTNNKINLNQIENEIDKFILNAGDIGQKTTTLIDGLNSKINSIIKN